MFDFMRVTKSTVFEEFNILLSEAALPAGETRLGDPIWFRRYGEPHPRHFRIGRFFLIHGKRGDKPDTRVILIHRDGLTDAERQELVTEIEILLGHKINVDDASLATPERMWFAEDTYY